MQNCAKRKKPYMMKQKKQLNPVMFLVLMTLFAGCAASKITMFPITDKDIYFKDNGDICMSEFYFNQVLEAKIEKIKK